MTFERAAHTLSTVLPQLPCSIFRTNTANASALYRGQNPQNREKRVSEGRSVRKTNTSSRTAQEPKRNRKPEPSEPFFPDTERGTRTVGAVFNPVLPFLAFGEFLFFFFPRRGIPCSFGAFFPSFPGDFMGSVGIKNPCFFGGFPCHFPKKIKDGQGRNRNQNRNRPFLLKSC